MSQKDVQDEVKKIIERKNQQSQKCVGCGGIADPQCVDQDGNQLPFCLACEHFSEVGIE